MLARVSAGGSLVTVESSFELQAPGWTTAGIDGEDQRVTTQRFKITRAQRIEALRRQIAEGRLGHVGPNFPEPPAPAHTTKAEAR